MSYFASGSLDAFIQFYLPPIVFSLVLYFIKGESLGIALLALIAAAFIPRVNWPDKSETLLEVSLFIVWMLPSIVAFYSRIYSRWVVLLSNLFLLSIQFFLPFALLGWLALMIICLIKCAEASRSNA